MNSDELPLTQSDPTESFNSEHGIVDASELTLQERIADLEQQEQSLQQEIAALQATRDQLQAQTVESQSALGRLVQQSLGELEQRKQTLQLSIEQLERRQERIRSEMRTTFAGASQDIAIRVQSFKDYLVGSLQDLADAADQLELVKDAPVRSMSAEPLIEKVEAPRETPKPKFGESQFQEDASRVRRIIDQFRNQPDYYGPVWKLRRTFEAVHAERVSEWFFTQGGRGAIRTMGSRLQNILIASAAISILYNLYSDRVRALVLASSPEQLGEWRRGLQDCLGVSRTDFGADRGIGLFEVPEQLVLKAERLSKEGYLPVIVMDETIESVNLGLLQFPMWLAFAPTAQQMMERQNSFY
jgi:Protein of unknown function (DUF3086)